jgi:hypothetical protein
MPGSYDECKPETLEFIRLHIPPARPILDIGAGNGNWGIRLRNAGYTAVDGLEAYDPYVARFALASIYRNVFVRDVRLFKNFKDYSLCIMGDILEHLPVDDALEVLHNILASKCLVTVAVPWLFEQGALEGNSYEIHRQPDLTPDIMKQRYHMLRPLKLGPAIGVYIGYP